MATVAPAGSGTIVLVHGLSGSRRWWRHTAADLGRDHRVVAVDLLGFGERRRSGPFRLDRAAEALAAELAGDAGRVGLVGHSMGGLVAAQLAAERPDLVDRLVLVAAPVVPFEWGLPRHAWNILRSVTTVVPRFVPVLARDAARAGPLTIASAARQLLAADVTAQLPRIDVPTLLVWGSGDRLVPPPIGRAAADRVPHGRYAEIEGAGHVPMWERPDEFNALLRSFLDADREPDADADADAEGGP